MKYYVARNGQATGPFTTEELVNMDIKPDTLVWNDTMTEWKAASDIQELRQKLSLVPPLPEESSTHICPNTYLAQAILCTIFCCLPFGIVAIVKASAVTSRFDLGDYAGAEEMSRSAKNWVTAAFWTGVGLAILYLLYFSAVFLTVSPHMKY